MQIRTFSNLSAHLQIRLHFGKFGYTFANTFVNVMLPICNNEVLILFLSNKTGFLGLPELSSCRHFLGFLLLPTLQKTSEGEKWVVGQIQSSQMQSSIIIDWWGLWKSPNSQSTLKSTAILFKEFTFGQGNDGQLQRPMRGRTAGGTDALLPLSHNNWRLSRLSAPCGGESLGTRLAPNREMNIRRSAKRCDTSAVVQSGLLSNQRRSWWSLRRNSESSWVWRSLAAVAEEQKKSFPGLVWVWYPKHWNEKWEVVHISDI